MNRDEILARALAHQYFTGRQRTGSPAEVDREAKRQTEMAWRSFLSKARDLIEEMDHADDAKS